MRAGSIGGCRQTRPGDHRQDRRNKRSEIHVHDHDSIAISRECGTDAAADAPCFPGDQRITIRGLSWDLYDRLSDAIDPRQHIYLAYDGKDLEIMTKGRCHEHYKELFGRFVSTLTAALMIRRATLGETSWKRPEIARGLEAEQTNWNSNAA